MKMAHVLSEDQESWNRDCIRHGVLLFATKFNVMQTITWLHNNFLHQQDLSKHPNIKQQMAGWRMHCSHAVI